LRSVEDARDEILRHFAPLAAEHVALEDALGRVAAADIAADTDVPPFANSAMDGFALRAADIVAASSSSPVALRVLGEVPAGGVASIRVEPGSALRIMTGAPVPPGADTVTPFEDTDVWGAGGAAEGPTARPSRPQASVVRVLLPTARGANIRAAGEDVRAGTPVVRRGTLLRPGEIGVLATAGAATVPVFRRPRVAILATGDELVEVGQRPGPGQIRNANGYSNAAQVLDAGGEPLRLPIARDTEAELHDRIDRALAAGADLFLSSGGVSVGDYDVVKRVLEQRGRMEFWRVRMKPGKPLAFGIIDGVPLLGLPGNPVSAMVGFELFGRPALLKMLGRERWQRPVIQAAYDGSYADRGDRRVFVRVAVEQHGDGWVARSAGEQGSGVLSAMMRADGLMVVPEGMTRVEPGTRLPVIMLRWPEQEARA